MSELVYSPAQAVSYRIIREIDMGRGDRDVEYAVSLQFADCAKEAVVRVDGCSIQDGIRRKLCLPSDGTMGEVLQSIIHDTATSSDINDELFAYVAGVSFSDLPRIFMVASEEINGVEYMRYRAATVPEIKKYIRGVTQRRIAL